MRRLLNFKVAVAATAFVALVGAVLSALGVERAGLTALNVALAGFAVSLFLAERDRRSRRDDVRKAVAAAVDSRLQRLDDRVDMMQRRVIASLESARLEAADRERQRLNENA